MNMEEKIRYIGLFKKIELRIIKLSFKIKKTSNSFGLFIAFTNNNEQFIID